MKYFNDHKAGAKMAPALLIFMYYIFVLSDIYTTYLVTPDLKFEANWFVRLFNLDWFQIIICTTIITGSLSTIYLFVLNYLHVYFKRTFDKTKYSFFGELLHNKVIIISLFFMGCFYSHFFGSIFVSINNFFNFIYLHKPGSGLINISTSYVKFETFLFPYFYLYTQIIIVITGFAFTFYKVKMISNKYFIKSY